MGDGGRPRQSALLKVGGETERRKDASGMRFLTPASAAYGLFHGPGGKGERLFIDPKTGREQPWDLRREDLRLRSGQHFTLKWNRLRYEALQG
jgi:hypothetical protein